MAGSALLALALLGAVGCDFSSVAPPTPIPIRIREFDGNSCMLAGFPRRLTFRIDPTATDQVMAVDETGMRHEVWWPRFQGGTSNDPVVRDPRGLVVARDGEALAIPPDVFPVLHGYSVCAGNGGIWVTLHSP